MQEGLDHPARRACPSFVFLSEKETSAMNRPLNLTGQLPMTGHVKTL